MKNQMVFDVEWAGERGAGINPGSEVVTVSFEYGLIDDETIEFFRASIAEYFDGAGVRVR